ncbi:MAG: hypothetical protein KDD66_03545 [Bdellovibrionales bacterium]|nr:hypothetical protein [Bdellovibrionales bacterium]
METIVGPVLLIFAGVCVLYRNISCMRDEGKLRDYLEKSPKAKRWVAKFGIEKTVDLSNKYFLPIGNAVAVGLLGLGLYSLIVAMT